MYKKNIKKPKSCSKWYNKEKVFNKIYNEYYNNNQNEFLPLVQKENNDKRFKSGAINFNSYRNNNKIIKSNDNNLFTNYPIVSELTVKKEDVRKISERLHTFKRPINQNITKNNNTTKLKRTSSGNKIKHNINLQNYYRKESTDNLIKRKDELGNKNEEKEKKIKNLKEDNHNNKEDEKYDIKVLLKEIKDLKQEKIKIEKEIYLKNQKDQNEIKSLKEKLNEIEKENKELKKNQEKISLLRKENATREQSEIEEKEKVKDSFSKNIILKYSYNPKNSSFEEIERRKFNQSMELANSRYPKDKINSENKNDVNHLLNFKNSLINQLMNNTKENQFLTLSEKEAYPNISKLKYIKNFLRNANEKKRIENSQKNEDGPKSHFNNKLLEMSKNLRKMIKF